MAKSLTADLGKRTKKGTLITQGIVDAFNNDQAEIEVIEDNTQRVLNAIPAAIGNALESIGLAAEGFAIKLAPVDTGRLRNSITHTIDGGTKTVYIGTNVEYAPYVELGTSTQDPQPFLVPAAQDHVNEYRDILKNAMENAG